MAAKDNFLKKCKEKFGDKYDYSKVEYVNVKTKVCIICPKHGEFWQLPSNFIAGKGCPLCALENRSGNTSKFIEKAKEIYGNKYDYSKVEYKNNKVQVCIICPKHGEFYIKPNNHLNGHGCPKCAAEERVKKNSSTTEEFIERAKQVHGDKYDYSKVEYKNEKTKVCIICPKHGEFWQAPTHHLSGSGCKECAVERVRDSQRKTLEQFIEDARKVHGDKYDYSKVEYVRALSKICVVCPIHGEFLIRPNDHLNGKGCPKCAYKNSAKIRAKTTRQFIEQAKQIHGDKYDYSKVKYINSHTKICIICPIHGEFLQMPYDHLNGKGCKLCRESKMETYVRKVLLKHNIKFESQKRFEWLGLQSLDFYLPKYNIAIECQGIQHYKPVSFGSKKLNKFEMLDLVKKRDENKKRLCEEHNIKILYFSTEICAYNVIKDENKLLEEINKL